LHINFIPIDTLLSSFSLYSVNDYHQQLPVLLPKCLTHSSIGNRITNNKSKQHSEKKLPILSYQLTRRRQIN